jgi:hypothetical protein
MGARWGRGVVLAACALCALAALACSGKVRQEGDPENAWNGGGAAASGNGQAGNAGNAGNGGTNVSGSGGASGSSGNTGPLIASESVARRMSRSELDHVLRDLLGDTANAASELLSEDAYSPFDNDYTTQTIGAAQVDSFASLADDVAARIVTTPELRGQLLPCEPTGADDLACFRQTAAQLTRRAFRRTLSDDELEPYLGLLDFATEDIAEVDNDFDTALELLLRAVLMDPEFLYRIEAGEPTDMPDIYALSGVEIATRMSFLIWGSIPDDALLEAAEAGELTTTAGRRAQVERMLDDERAREQLHRFHAMWLGYRVIPHAAELAAAFDRETTALLDRVIFEERASYTSLFTYAETYLDDALADHYGLPHPDGGEGWVDYGDSGRAGILSHGAVLSAFGKFSDTSPTQRGILIRSRLLCETIAPPPPTVMADKPPGDMSAVCKWDRYAEHRASGGSCASCHSQMDPIGFGLENYDLAGRYREHDDGLPECAISGEGELPPYGSFSGPAELGALLVDSGAIERCVVQQVLTFALGRTLEPEENGFVDALTEQLVEHDTALTELLHAYVASDAFVLRKEPAP